MADDVPLVPESPGLSDQSSSPWPASILLRGNVRQLDDRQATLPFTMESPMHTLNLKPGLLDIQIHGQVAILADLFPQWGLADRLGRLVDVSLCRAASAVGGGRAPAIVHRPEPGEGGATAAPPR